jgi:hypothetical protein
VIRFLDGPAAGVSLMLRRAPVVLRVVSRPPRGKDDTVAHGLAWDALDQLDDLPEPRETVHVYRRQRDPTWFHLCIRGKGKRAAGFYAVADYRLYWRQPDGTITRDTAAWRAWCEDVRRGEAARAAPADPSYSADLAGPEGGAA